ncbi:ABC transporter ATP-binding protein [Cognatishimia sp. SS12]|uniref:ABC transporter ATP-binding protein n=1 Tax=Cognatishimia sp. SS12 TaxID=2979465 RepID=UPI00232C65AC|nr:ABC transporter ATP-binding protein [Cognatishimia sp. SS12]MDC0739308.1 ABC transporter ATP-binding protein [Cognatishimia sp. SS12]
MSEVLKVDGVSRRFGGLLAVNNVSFAIEPGQIVGLLGPNGSGKTTMLNMISGALKVSGGQIAFQDQLVTGLPAHKIAKRGVARTFQLVRSLPSLTLTENVLISAAYGRERLWGAAALDKVAENLALVGLEGRGDEPVADLTYIDLKRMELARAMVADPKLLLLDEWLAGLNPAELQIGVDLIRRLQQRGITILLVEHIMDAVRATCARCIVMSAGAVIADGPTDQALADPEVIRAYLGDDDA